MKESIDLTLVPKGYNGRFKRVELMTFGTHDIKVGVYLQIVEGCGYDVYNLTSGEARRLGNLLIEFADKAEKEVKDNDAD